MAKKKKAKAKGGRSGNKKSGASSKTSGAKKKVDAADIIPVGKQGWLEQRLASTLLNVSVDNVDKLKRDQNDVVLNLFTPNLNMESILTEGTKNREDDDEAEKRAEALREKAHVP